MKLIVGLGNPGEKYRDTRHNLGFIFLDKFREENGFGEWKYESRFTADISSGILNGEKTFLVKPQTFMNLSGESVAKICNFYKLSSEDFIVIYDDISMEFGKIRVRETGSAGGHNGVKSIIQHFNTDWKRIKVGVGSAGNYDVSDWVLSKFTADELIDIDTEIYNKIISHLSPTLSGEERKQTQKKHKLQPHLPSQGRVERGVKKVYLVGIGGIGVSALARYYISQNWHVFGSDKCDSKLIHALQNEGCDIIIGSDESRITTDIKLVIYSEAIPKTQQELQKASKLGIKTLRYNDALGEVVNSHKLIAVTGTHGKSTTTSMISQILKNSDEDFKAIIGTLLKEFDGKNFYSSRPHSSPIFEKERKNHEVSEIGYFTIEACEYKEHFLAYKPTVGVITNIEYDHADYFKTPANYIKAYEKFIENILPGGFCVINGEDTNCKTLIGKRKDIHYIILQDESYSMIFPGESQKSNTEYYPEIVMHVPGKHILFDAKLAYIVSQMIGIAEIIALETLEDYSGVWRRMEKIGTTQHGNILMSDYGHHPTEVATTLAALKSGYPDRKLYVVFQPHQYSRTIELLEGFQTCFTDADTLIVPDIYESRDSDENKAKMNSQIFVEALVHPNKIDGNGLENTLKLIQKYDSENPDSSIILLLGAGNIDNLRYKIKTS